jgi:hypothetical protein
MSLKEPRISATEPTSQSVGDEPQIAGGFAASPLTRRRAEYTTAATPKAVTPLVRSNQRLISASNAPALKHTHAPTRRAQATQRALT